MDSIHWETLFLVLCLQDRDHCVQPSRPNRHYETPTSFSQLYHHETMLCRLYHASLIRINSNNGTVSVDMPSSLYQYNNLCMPKYRILMLEPRLNVPSSNYTKRSRYTHPGEGIRVQDNAHPLLILDTTTSSPFRSLNALLIRLDLSALHSAHEA